MILLKVSLINKEGCSHHCGNLPYLYSFTTHLSLAVFAGDYLHSCAYLSAAHGGNAFQPFAPDKSFTRQYFLELIKVGLVQPVRSDTGIIYTFHNFSYWASVVFHLSLVEATSKPRHLAAFSGPAIQNTMGRTWLPPHSSVRLSPL